VAASALELAGFDVRLLFCVRHPLATYRSWASRGGARGWVGRDLDADPRVWSGRWLDETASALELLVAPERDLAVVRLEDVLLDARATSESLCRQIGVPATVDEMVAAVAQPLNSSFPDRPVDVSGGDPEAPDPQTEGEAFVVERCAARARAFGYVLGDGLSGPWAADRLDAAARCALAALPARAVAGVVAADLRARAVGRLASRPREAPIGDVKTGRPAP